MSCLPSPLSRSNPHKKQGFTLVELLIVLVIISIMSGLLITVIDPVRQRARARDGTITASANKIIATIQAFNAATGVYPTCPELMADLQNDTILVGCTGNTGTIAITGITPPNCIAADRYTLGVTTDPTCGFHYERNATGDAACLGAAFHSAENLDDVGSTNLYLLWSTALGGRVVDRAGPTCSSPTTTTPV